MTLKSSPLKPFVEEDDPALLGLRFLKNNILKSSSFQKKNVANFFYEKRSSIGEELKVISINGLADDPEPFVLYERPRGLRPLYKT